MKKILLLMICTGLGIASIGQSKDRPVKSDPKSETLVPIPFVEYQRTLDNLAECRRHISVIPEKDTLLAKKEREIQRKETVIVNVLKERNNAWDENRRKDSVIARHRLEFTQMEDLYMRQKKVSQRGSWTIGGGPSYGVFSTRDGLRSGPGVSIGLYKTFIRL